MILTLIKKTVPDIQVDAISIKFANSVDETEGFSINGLKSFQVFLGRFGVIDVSYLNVRMLVIEECSGDKKLDSTSKSSKN